MASSVKNMTKGRPVTLLITFALPLMLGNVFQQLYTVVDTAVVGQALGVHALAALGACDWLNWMVLGTVQGLTQGFAVLMAQEFGADRTEGLRTALGNSITLSVACAAVLTVGSQLLARPVLLLLQTLLFTTMYALLPSRRNRFVDSFPGAVMSALGWTAFSDLFSLYVTHFPRYSNLFGSVYGLALGMLWLYFCICIVLYGGALNRWLKER